MQRETLKKVLFLWAGLIILPLFSYTQDKKINGEAKDKNENVINLDQADRFTVDNTIAEGAVRLLGNVIISHKNTKMTCDSAYLYSDTACDAFGRIIVNKQDTLLMNGTYLHYNSLNSTGWIKEKVRLKELDEKGKLKMLLITDSINFDLKKNVMSYGNGGTITAPESENTLTSKKGLYYSSSKTFFFKERVKVTNPDYIIESDTLEYRSEEQITFFHGPSTIKSDENFIYCENGWYNSKTERCSFNKNAYIISKDQKLEGDSIFYDRSLGVGQAIGKIVLTDTTSGIIAKGNYAVHRELVDQSMITDDPLIEFLNDKDTLFLHSDSIFVYTDTLSDKKTILAYNRVQFLNGDIQGRADSIAYIEKDSTIEIYNFPILWLDEQQLTGDYMEIGFSKNEIKTLSVFGSTLLISNAEVEADSISDYFNQIKGKNLIAYFDSNDIKKIEITGNGQSVYYVKEEDGSLIGLNKAICSDITVMIDSNEIKGISFITKPISDMFPPNVMNPKDKFLKGFQWFPELRPKSVKDLYIWKELHFRGLNDEEKLKEKVSPKD